MRKVTTMKHPSGTYGTKSWKQSPYNLGPNPQNPAAGNPYFLTTYSIRKNPTAMLSITPMTMTASGYSSGKPLSASGWNSGKVPKTKVRVEIRTTPKDVKAITCSKNDNILRLNSEKPWSRRARSSCLPVLYAKCTTCWEAADTIWIRYPRKRASSCVQNFEGHSNSSHFVQFMPNNGIQLPF